MAPPPAFSQPSDGASGSLSASQSKAAESTAPHSGAPEQMDETCAAYEKAYMEPYLLSGLFNLNFSRQDHSAFVAEDAQKPGVWPGAAALICWFEDDTGDEQMHAYWTKYYAAGPEPAPETDGIPAKIVDDVLTAHFELTAEELHAYMANDSGTYQPDRDVYLYYGGRGGICPVCVVTDAEKEGDTVTLRYAFYEVESTLPEGAVPARLSSGTLTVLEQADGGFVYLANQSTRRRRNQMIRM